MYIIVESERVNKLPSRIPIGLTIFSVFLMFFLGFKCHNFKKKNFEITKPDTIRFGIKNYIFWYKLIIASEKVKKLSTQTPVGHLIYCILEVRCRF